MATARDTHHDDDRILSSDEAAAMLDQAAQLYLGMSGADFQRKWEAGAIDADDPELHGKIAWVAMFLPLAGDARTT